MEYLECKAFYNYYLSLEKDCFATEQYAAFHEINFRTFSIEYAKLLLSLCCEIETVLKKICFELNLDQKYRNIAQYRNCIREKLLFFSDEVVYFKNIHKEFSPWLSWKELKTPVWWNQYNAIKHKRAECDTSGTPNFFHANQENVLNALAALYVSEQYLFYLCEIKYKYSKDNKSQALQYLSSNELIIKAWNRCYLSFMGSSWVDINCLRRLMETRNQ